MKINSGSSKYEWWHHIFIFKGTISIIIKKRHPVKWVKQILHRPNINIKI